MGEIQEYFRNTLGGEAQVGEVPLLQLDRLPYFVRGQFRFYTLKFMKSEVLLVEPRESLAHGARQLQRLLATINTAMGGTTALLLKKISPSLRSGLIRNKTNFVVPGKQFFMPDLMIELSERFDKRPIEGGKLLPSAQALLICWILKRSEGLEEYNFNQIAEQLRYSPMAITQAVYNLRRFNLCEVIGTRSKRIHFHLDRRELWDRAKSLFTNPIRFSIRLDVVPQALPTCVANLSALAEYTDLGEGAERHYAVWKRVYDDIMKDRRTNNDRDLDGPIHLELWKYDPGLFANRRANSRTVDPLSLYLCLRDSHDERISKAVDQLLEGVKW